MLSQVAFNGQHQTRLSRGCEPLIAKRAAMRVGSFSEVWRAERFVFFTARSRGVLIHEGRRATTGAVDFNP